MIFLLKSIAGIRPAEPGFPWLEIKPGLNVFVEFRCVVPTPHGDIAVKLEDGIFFYHLPAGITAEIVIRENRTIIEGRWQQSRSIARL